MASSAHKKNSPARKSGRARNLTRAIKFCIIWSEGTWHKFSNFIAKPAKLLKSRTGSIFVNPRSHSSRTSGHIARRAEERNVKWFSKTRFGAFIAVLATAFILVACGGGGSSSEPVAATQPGQQGGSTAADSSTTPPPTGEVCTTGLIIDNICQPAPAHYSRKVVALWDGGYPFMVTATGVTRAINKTSFAGTQPFINCGLLNADRVEADGHVQVKCTYVGDSKRYIIQLDPATGELSDFHGTELPDDQFVLAENNSVQPVAGTTSALGEDGWYYANPNGRVELDLLRSDGTTTVVKQGSLQTNGNLNVLRSYTF